MMTNLKNGKHVELTTEEIKVKAKSVFATAPLSSLTDKYIFVPTSQLISDMKNLGWICIDATELRSKKRDGYQKHMLAFKNPDVVIKSEQDGDSFPLILMQNSHDGFSSFKLNVGIYRLVCSNGLVIAEKEFAKKTIRHKGYSFETLKKNVEETLKQIPDIVEYIQKLSTIKVDRQLQIELAKKAYSIRYDGTIPTEETLETLLEVNRKEDNSNDMWTVINRIQERLINGGFYFTTKKGKQRKSRAIKNFVNDIKVNQQLFEIANEFIS